MVNYERLLKRHSLNVINCVTLVHRIGSVFAAVDRPSRLYDHKCAFMMGHITLLLSSFHQELDARQISNIIWALGNIGRRLLTLQHGRVSIPELYSLLFHQMTELDTFRPQEIGSCISGLARMKFKKETCRPVLDHLTQIAIVKIDAFEPQELANAVWGLGSLLYLPENDFIKTAVQRTAETLLRFNPRQMSNVVWGLARLNVRFSGSHLLPLLEKYLVQEIWSFTEQGMPLVLWSFAKLKYLPHTSTLDKAMRVTRDRLCELSSQSISHVIYACAIFNYAPSPDILALLKERFLEKRESFTPQLTCLVIWSLAVLFSLDLNLFKVIMKEMETRDRRRELSSSEMRQLYQCMIHVQFFVSGGNRAVEGLSKELLSDCQMAWEEGQSSKWRDSVCLAVMVQLQSMGYIADSQHLASRGLARFSVDIIRRANHGERIAVEITIPMHRFINDSLQIEGPRQWSMKLLRKKGFRILQVEGEVWKNLETEERAEYLKQLLNQLQG